MFELFEAFGIVRLNDLPASQYKAFMEEIIRSVNQPWRSKRVGRDEKKNRQERGEVPEAD